MAKLPSRIEPKLDDQITEVENQLTGFIKDVNNDLPPPKQPREITHFERLGDELGKAFTAAATNVVNDAQNFLQEVTIWIEGIQREIADKTKEYQQLVERQKKLGTSLLDAHKEYHNRSE